MSDRIESKNLDTELKDYLKEVLITDSIQATSENSLTLKAFAAVINDNNTLRNALIDEGLTPAGRMPAVPPAIPGAEVLLGATHAAILYESIGIPRAAPGAIAAIALLPNREGILHIAVSLSFPSQTFLEEGFKQSSAAVGVEKALTFLGKSFTLETRNENLRHERLHMQDTLDGTVWGKVLFTLSARQALAEGFRLEPRLAKFYANYIDERHVAAATLISEMRAFTENRVSQQDNSDPLVSVKMCAANTQIIRALQSGIESNGARSAISTALTQAQEVLKNVGYPAVVHRDAVNVAAGWIGKLHPDVYLKALPKDVFSRAELPTTPQP